jgi:hypothetical protein
LAFVTSLDGVDAVMKQSGPNVPYSNDFLGGGNTREVTTASTAVEIVQYFVIFVDGKTSSKNGINLESIENVSDEKVLGGMMENVSMIISREMRPKKICMKVDEEVTILRVIGGDEEDVFIGEILIDGGRFGVRWKSHNEFN